MRMLEPTTRYQAGRDRVFVNNGITIWEGSGAWRGEARFVNNGTLVLPFQNPTTYSFVFSSLTDAFTNRPTGIIRKTGPGKAFYESGLVNDGVIQIQEGIVEFAGFNSTGVAGAGSVEISSGARLRIGGGNNVFTTESSISGEGTIEMAAGRLEHSGTYDLPLTVFSAFSTLEINGTGQTDSLNLAAGVLGGSGEFTVLKDLAWAGGTMDGTGTTTLGPNVPLTIGGANIGLKGTRTLRVEGTTTWTGDADFSNSSGIVFENAGTLISSGAGTRSYFAGMFINLGSVIHDTGGLIFHSGMSNSGVVTITSGVVTQNGFNATGGTDSGKYEVGSDGRLEFAGGNRTLTETATIVGDGTVVFAGGNLTNNATWQPTALLTNPDETGILAVDGAFPVAGILDVGIGGTIGGTEYDQFNVTGAATLAGTLNVALLNGFNPADGDRFLIIPAADGATGKFDEVILPDGLEAYVDVSSIGVELVRGIPTSNESESVVPDEFELKAAYPNPFAARTTIPFAVPEAASVRIELYDVLGRQVAVAFEGDKSAGEHHVSIDGSRLAAGPYLVRMTTREGFIETTRIVVSR